MRDYSLDCIKEVCLYLEILILDFVRDRFLYNFSFLVLDSSYYVGFINKIESSFETPNSCMEFYTYPYPRPVYTNTLMYD